MDALLLSRWQFAITTVYHFLFVPITLGLSIFVALLETCYVRTKRPAWKETSRKLVRFFGTLFIINFSMGVVTGIVQEFHFGMNWSEYARFMGDIFGAPLALEALTAFFLESTFIGIWIFGWDKLSEKAHCICIWIVAFASNLSAFWILVANSFMQHPVGYAISNGRAEMTDFLALITNPYVIGEYSHTLFSAIATAGFLVIAVSAWKILHDEVSRQAFTQTLKAGGIFMLLGLFAAMGSGHMHTQYLAQAIPAMFSMMLYNEPSGAVTGINQLQEEYAAQYGFGEYRPDVTGMFWSFRIMIGLGGLMLLLAFVAAYLGWKKCPMNFPIFLKLLPWLLPLPFIANSVGWYIAEGGRQPWIVFGLQKTSEAVSPNLTSSDVWLTMVGFTLIYLVLAIAALWIAVGFIKKTHIAFDEGRKA